MNSKQHLIINFGLLMEFILVSTLLINILKPDGLAHAAGPRYVAPGGNDSNSCLSVSAPCVTINGAIGKASAGDTIYVATGTYTGTGNDVVRIDKNLTLSGGWNTGFTTQVDESEVDGEAARSGIQVIPAVTANIDHFTIQNSDSGIQNFGVLTLTRSIISYNTSGYGPGGGIFGGYGALTNIIDTQIFGNEAAEDGGGIYLDNSDLTLIRSWVVGNAAIGNDGGGIQIDGDSSSYIENSIIAGNFTNGDGGGIRGGPHHIINSHIIGNVSGGGGGAFDSREETFIVTNTLIISNIGETGIDGREGSIITLDHCDTFGNSPDDIYGVIITRTNCLGTPQEDGLDPMLAGGPLPSGVGPAYADQWMAYDYHLTPGSPAVNAGTSDGAPISDIDLQPRPYLAPDIGADEYWPPGALKLTYLPLVIR